MSRLRQWLNAGGFALGAVCAVSLSAIEFGTYGTTAWGVGLLAVAVILMLLGTTDEPA